MPGSLSGDLGQIPYLAGFWGSEGQNRPKLGQNPKIDLSQIQPCGELSGSKLIYVTLVVSSVDIYAHMVWRCLDGSVVTWVRSQIWLDFRGLKGKIGQNGVKIRKLAYLKFSPARS